MNETLSIQARNLIFFAWKFQVVFSYQRLMRDHCRRIYRCFAKPKKKRRHFWASVLDGKRAAQLLITIPIMVRRRAEIERIVTTSLNSILFSHMITCLSINTTELRYHICKCPYHFAFFLIGFDFWFFVWS